MSKRVGAFGEILLVEPNDALLAYFANFFY